MSQTENPVKRIKSIPMVRRLNRWAWTEILAALALLIAVLGFWWNTGRRETETKMNSLLSIYGEQIEQRFAGMDRAMSILLENAEDLALMGDASETERQHAMVRMRNRLQNTLLVEESAEWGIAASSAFGAAVQAGTGSPSFAQKEQIGRDALLAASDASGISAGWEEKDLDGEAFLCRRVIRRGQALLLYIRRSTLLGLIHDQESGGLKWSILSEGMESEGPSSSWFTPLRLERTLSGTPFRLICIQDSSEASWWIRGEIAVLLSMAALLLAFTLYLRRALRKSLFHPMASLESDMRKIRAGDYDLRVSTQSDAQEFQQMTGTLNQLLEEVLQLRIRELEKQLALQEANQKYIRLQLRPHFFLNAMATVSALSAKNRTQEIQTYIDALSRNIRYMFSAGMHTVPVREELLHVQNYLKMQELKYPDCVFSYVELPEELGDWPIPQMIVHTVVENEYKYAVSRDQMLMLLIRVSLETHQNEDLLLIEIEDDGQGYPQDIIDLMNTTGRTVESDGTRVGLWSIRTLLELMYDRTGLLELANQSPHGAIARIRVPRKAVREIRLDREESSRLSDRTTGGPAPVQPEGHERADSESRRAVKQPGMEGNAD